MNMAKREPDAETISFSSKSSAMSSMRSSRKANIIDIKSSHRPSNESKSGMTKTWLDRPKESITQGKLKGKVTCEIKFPPNFNGLFSLRYSPKGDFLVTGFGQGAIQLRYNNGEMKRTIRSGGHHTFPLMAIRFHPIMTDIFFAASACGNVFKCNTNTGEYARFVEEPKNEINTVDISYEGTTLATGGRDTAVRIYDADTGVLKQMYSRDDIILNTEKQLRFHRMRVYCAKFHPRSSETLITGGWDDIVRVWDLRNPEGCVRLIRGPHICGDGLDIRDKIMVTGSWTMSESLQMWDFGSNKLISTITPTNRVMSNDGEFLYCCQYYDGFPEEDIVVTAGSGIGAVEVISIKEKKILGSYKAQKAVYGVDSYRNSIAFGGMDTMIRIVDYNAEDA